ncbi:hypothetical protein K2173_026015 [Erythroxylum novogranatense]|uniref:Protein FLX-like 2 n=1 Tax=Erythroxylum novogranatense TaxID=1862640 RepID=A0AAV8SHU0_9ROSI|nr:hypothetical protein K2173_026015 [Erythroxylum novogranatense]
MGSKGRMQPPHLRRPPLGTGIVHPDAFGPGVHPPPGPFPPFEMLSHPEVMEQKLAAQHVEMQRIATENQRLAVTHGTLRQELAAAKHELQILHAHIGLIKSEREQQMRGLMDKIAKMEAELKDAEPVKLELQQARTDADNLVAARQELMTKMHQLTQDLHRAHADVQQIPALMSELDGLRQEYQQCRISYDYEKKLFNDHLEQLQAMEKNYMTMAREVEKLRSELTNTPNVDIRTGGPYGTASGNNENEVTGRPVGQNLYEDSYGTSQSQVHATIPANPAAASRNVTAATSVSAVNSTSAYVGAQSSTAPTKGPVYDAPKGSGYNAPRGLSQDAQRGPSYGGPVYDVQRMPGYDPQRMHGYDIHRGQNYLAQRGPGYELQRAPSHDAMSRGATGSHGQVAPANSVPYGSATPPTRAGAGSGYEIPTRSGNPGRR